MVVVVCQVQTMLPRHRRVLLVSPWKSAAFLGYFNNCLIWYLRGIEFTLLYEMKREGVVHLLSRG